jgi:hypothetical protein
MMNMPIDDIVLWFIRFPFCNIVRLFPFSLMNKVELE